MAVREDRFQIVWWWSKWWTLWPRWQPWRGSMRYIYRWSFCFGPFELRRWTPADERPRLMQKGW